MTDAACAPQQRPMAAANPAAAASAASPLCITYVNLRIGPQSKTTAAMATVIVTARWFRSRVHVHARTLDGILLLGSIQDTLRNEIVERVLAKLSVMAFNVQ